MTNLLLKIFIKNRNDTENAATRDSVCKMSGIVCIILNILLAAAKIVVGALFGLVSVLADGMNNLSDCGSNIVSVVGVTLASKPADKGHPYGHRRAEYVAAMVVAFIVLVVAVELCIESVTKIVDTFKGNSAEIPFEIVTIVILSVSILVKFWMFFFNRKLGRRFGSDLLKATSIDSISDVCATGAVLVSVIISHYAGFNIDGFMGVAVAVVIAVAGIKILRETYNNLIGAAPDGKLVESVVARIKQFSGVLGVHDLNIHNYGPDKYYASVHVEVDSSVSVLESHDMIDQIERDFAENTNITLVIHLDPIVIGDAKLDEYKAEVEKIVVAMDEHFTIHDFRMVKGPTHTNLIFDLAVHYDTKLTRQQITEYIHREINKQYSDVYVVPTVEKQIG